MLYVNIWTPSLPALIFLKLPPVLLYLGLSICVCTALVDLGRFSRFLDLYAVDRTPWKGDQPIARPLPKHRINAHRHPCFWVGFEPTIPVLKQAKTVHALDRAATVIGIFRAIVFINNWNVVNIIWTIFEKITSLIFGAYLEGPYFWRQNVRIHRTPTANG
jgi:hypothetical protein